MAGIGGVRENADTLWLEKILLSSWYYKKTMRRCNPKIYVQNVYKALRSPCFQEYLAKPVAGYLVIVIFLASVAAFCPRLYRKITYWANQSDLPYLTSCELKPMTSNIKGVPNAMRDLHTFTASLTFENGGAANALVFTEDAHFQLLRANQGNVLIFTKLNFKNNHPISFDVMVDVAEGEPDQAYEPASCPFQIAFFRGRSE